ncbi:hypothetical protein, partial [Limnospira sp. PMC 917.15]|uniref:hypothetical protein n=1 Tax=Limnospira sp. PMC 917.15 TaxID=2981106 RepID=UPI0028E12591
DQDRVFEPTAGNGALLTLAAPSQVEAGEADPQRANFLAALGVACRQTDMLAEIRPDAVPNILLLNPPFGQPAGGGFKSLERRREGRNFQINRQDLAYAWRGLESLADDGRAVLILAGPPPHIRPRGRD